MAGVALALYALYGLLAFGVRVAIHLRRTGNSGVRGISGRPGSVEWLAGVTFAAAIAVSVAGPTLAAADVVEPLPALDVSALHVAGFVLFGVGLVGTVLSQAAMGTAWRIGVDEDERTELVDDGPFAVVRNPIYAAMMSGIGGLTLLVPGVISIGGCALLVVALELQVRRVEEPYLRRIHGEAYSRYASRVGRFVPGVGRSG